VTPESVLTRLCASVVFTVVLAVLVLADCVNPTINKTH
jgi:hypothetical protein